MNQNTLSMNQNTIDPQGARKAFQQLEPRIRACDDLRRSNVDIQRVAVVAAAIGRMVCQPDMRVRFASLPASEFDITHVDSLEAMALATWHVSVERMTVTARTSDARVPQELVEEAKDLKQRMLKLATYYFEDDPAEGVEIASIREGNGHMDMAADLIRLGKLYERRQATLARDTNLYRPGDAHAASRMAHEILMYLGRDTQDEADEWSEMVTRAWSLLVSSYEEVSAAGRWLFRHEASVDELFPSLYAVGRTSARPRPADEPTTHPAEPARA